jgi:sporulation protein YlmC with PRC-barrel domain
MDQASILNMEGATVVDPTGDKIGTVEQIYLDDETGKPEWVAVRTGFFGLRSSLVPLQGANIQGNEVIVAQDKETVKDAPNIGAEDRLSRDEERSLYEHYGMQYTPWSVDNDAEGVRLRRYVVVRDPSRI